MVKEIKVDKGAYIKEERNKVDKKTLIERALEIPHEIIV